MRAASDDVIGVYRVTRASPSRRISMDAFAALPPSHKMLALVELDVTGAVAAVAAARAAGARVSLFAVVVRAIARALKEHPALNVVKHGGDVVAFDDVDVDVPMEVQTAEGLMPRQVLVRRADEKAPAAIFAELEAARRQQAERGNTGDEDRWSRRLMKVALLLPRFLRLWLIRSLAADPLRVKRYGGTTMVTSVSKWASMPGFVIPFDAGPMATMFALGSVSEKPAVRDGQVVVRTFLSVTMLFDHDVVDGAPASRFVKRVQELVEGADGV